MTARRGWLVLAMLVAPRAAHAFSDPALFGQPVAAGGGGGRYFTGSKVDGYGCSVCHHGGKPPRLVLEGVPDTLVTGTRYTLTVRWDHPEIPQAVQLELTTPSGAHPSVEVTPEAMLPAESRCEQLPAGTPAVYTFDVGARRIVGVEDCGASMVAVSFVATGEELGLALGAVRSDGSGTADGDGVVEQRLTLGQHLSASGGGGCSASTGRGSVTWGALATAIVVALRRRRRAHGRSSPTSAVSSTAHT